MIAQKALTKVKSKVKEAKRDPGSFLLLENKIKRRCSKEQYLSFKEIEDKLTFGPPPSDYTNNKRTFSCWRLKLFVDLGNTKKQT